MFTIAYYNYIIMYNIKYISNVTIYLRYYFDITATLVNYIYILRKL